MVAGQCIHMISYFSVDPSRTMPSVLTYNLGATQEVTGNHLLPSPASVCGACHMANNKIII